MNVLEARNATTIPAPEVAVPRRLWIKLEYPLFTQRPRVLSSREFADLEKKRGEALRQFREGDTLPSEAWIRAERVRPDDRHDVRGNVDAVSGAQTRWQLIDPSPLAQSAREHDESLPIMQLAERQIALQQTHAFISSLGPSLLARYNGRLQLYAKDVQSRGKEPRSTIAAHTIHYEGQYPYGELNLLREVVYARAAKRQEQLYPRSAIMSFGLLEEQKRRIDSFHNEWANILVGNKAAIEGELGPETVQIKERILGMIECTRFSTEPVGIHRLLAEYAENHRELNRFARHANILRSNGMRIADGVHELRHDLIQRRNAVMLQVDEKQAVASGMLSEMVTRISSAPQYASLSQKTILGILGIVVSRGEHGEVVYSAHTTSLARRFLLANAKKNLAASQFSMHLGDGINFDREAIGGLLKAAEQKLTQEKIARKLTSALGLKLSHALQKQKAAEKRKKDFVELRTAFQYRRSTV